MAKKDSSRRMMRMQTLNLSAIEPETEANTGPNRKPKLHDGRAQVGLQCDPIGGAIGDVSMLQLVADDQIERLFVLEKIWRAGPRARLALVKFENESFQKTLPSRSRAWDNRSIFLCDKAPEFAKGSSL